MKKTKLLYIQNVAMKVDNFSYTSMIAAQELGIEFHIACNWSYASDEERLADAERLGIKVHQIDFVRNPFHPGNLKAYSQLKKLVLQENFDIIHSNTPIGGVLGRIVANRCKVNKSIYQAHGFHFYKGAPLFNSTILKWAEQLMAHWSDAILTMNIEDFEAAKKFRIRKGGKAYFVHGVGVPVSSFENIGEARDAKRAELCLKEDDIALVSAGDLIPRKDYATSIRAIAYANNPQLHYFICGLGPERENLEALAKQLNVENQVHFLGFRTDVKELMAASDIFLFTTLQEGLPRSMMEAMAAGLPCIASEIRGNVDLIVNGENGYICAPKDVSGFADAIAKLSQSREIREEISKKNLEKIKGYDISVIVNETKDIYNEILGK